MVQLCLKQIQSVRYIGNFILLARIRIEADGAYETPEIICPSQSAHRYVTDGYFRVMIAQPNAQERATELTGRSWKTSRRVVAVLEFANSMSLQLHNVASPIAPRRDHNRTVKKNKKIANFARLGAGAISDVRLQLDRRIVRHSNAGHQIRGLNGRQGRHRWTRPSHTRSSAETRSADRAAYMKRCLTAPWVNTPT